MAVLTKLGRSAVHQLFTGQAVTAANTVSTDSFKMQRMADESGKCLVVLNQDPGASPNARLCVEGLMLDGSGDWGMIANIAMTNGAQPAGSARGLNAIVFYGPVWGAQFNFPAALEIRIATRAIGGAYAIAGGTTADVYLME